MIRYITRSYLAMAILLFAASLQAQTITVDDAVGVPGGMTSVALNWDNNGADYRSLQFDLTFDLGVLPAVDTTGCPITPYLLADGYIVSECSLRAVPNENQVRFGLARIAGAIPSGKLGDLLFSIASDAPSGPTDLTVTGVVIEFDPIPVINNGQVTVLGAAYSSDPAPGPFDFGSVIQNATDLSQSFDVSNSGAAGTTLSVTCTEGADAGGVFTVSPETEFMVDDDDPAFGVIVSCDSAGAITTHSGSMSCVHDGDGAGESSPAVYTFSCTITAGPQPAYTSDPGAGIPIDLAATFQGDPITPASLLITNSGDADTTLDGTCSFGMGTPQLTVSDGAFSLAQGASEAQSISCDSSVAGTYNATLTCAHNGSNGPNATYPVECVVGDPRPAVYSSTPAAGSTVDMTAGFVGGEAPVDSTIPPQDLVITNTAVAGSSDLGLSCNQLSPPQAGISVSPDLSAPFTLAPGDFTTATFSCGSATAGSYLFDYQCTYTTEGEGFPEVVDTANYTYTCEVREAESDVSVSPVSGSTLTELAETGGTATFEVVFSELADEGIDGSLVGCSLADGSNFAVISPVGFPAPIPADGSLTVVVEGTDPGDVESITDTLTCEYADSADFDPPVTVTYDLVMEIGGNGTFAVTKDFSDDNPAPVMVTLTCNTGIPLVQSFEITESTTVDFVVTDYESGAMNCSVTEEPVPGYATTYAASGDSTSDNIDGCNFTAVNGGDANACAITNTVLPVDVDVTKVWEVLGSVGDEVNMEYTLTATCNAPIVGGLPVEVPVDGQQNGFALYYIEYDGYGNGLFEFQVIPNLPYSTCTVQEDVEEMNVESDNGCVNIQVSVGNGAACTITNTVFFESIPTLSQWGMAIMALLMLGVGMVGFRRFA